MQKDITRELSLHFPLILENAVECIQRTDFEWLIIMNDGERILYDDYDKTVRTLPRRNGRLTEDECKTEFGRRLRKLMHHKNLSQYDLARLTGLSQTQISSYVTGKVTPGFYAVDKIADALGVSMDEFRYITD